MKKAELKKKEPITDARKQERIHQWGLHEKKWKEFNTNESLSLATIRNIHELQKQALWYAENTPLLFKAEWPKMDHIASLSVRYLCKLARFGNEAALRETGRIAIEVCELLDEVLHGESPEVDERVEELSWLARGLPYWPMLHFKHRQAVNHFQRLADKLHLGEECWLSVRDRANYSLQTPVNRLAWQCIRHFQEMHYTVTSTRRFEKGMAGETVTTILGKYVFNDRGQGMIYAQELPLYEASHRLSKLTKATAKQWVDVAFMPWIKVRFPDLRKVSGFKGINTGPHGRRYAPARRKLIEAVTGLAPEA